MYINLWYAAAFSAELKDDPVHVRMLGRDFVLFRNRQGQPLCLSNVCPHRGSSLAQGQVTEDGTIQCPQHGWRFGSNGQCVLIPALGDNQQIPKLAKVDAYPTQERYGLIWAFLGDDPERAPPIPPMPECELADWRMITHQEAWACNYHWAKLSNIDITHVPFVHGQNFLGPFPPKETITRLDPYSVESRISVPFEQPKGTWNDVRDKTKNVSSTLTFFASAFTLKGHLEIGGEGSGIYMTFYEMTTPIDAENSMMRYVFVRNFMSDPAFDEDTLKRNLKNVREDRAIAEKQLPKRGPSRTRNREFLIDPDDSLLRVYWEILDRLHDRGNQIDMEALDAADRGRQYQAIPSPARKAKATAWVHDTVPLYR